MGSGSKGSAKERELKDAFREAGWFCRRAGGSGAGGNASYDLIAAKDGTILLMELKYRGAGEDVYFDSEELFGDPDADDPAKQEGLVDVGEYFTDPDSDEKKVHVYAVVRWKRDTTFYGFIPDIMKTTPGGNPKVEPEHRDRAIELPPSGTDDDAQPDPESEPATD